MNRIKKKNRQSHNQSEYTSLSTPILTVNRAAIKKYQQKYSLSV